MGASISTPIKVQISQALNQPQNSRYIADIASVPESIYVGDSAGFKTFKNPVLSINDRQFISFSYIIL